MLQKIIVMIGVVTGFILLKTPYSFFFITKKFSLSRKKMIITIIKILIASIFFQL